MSDIPCPFPLYQFDEQKLCDGTEIAATKFCRNTFQSSGRCIEHYQSLADAEPGYYQCPFGYTTRKFEFEGGAFAITGVIAHPRFDTSNERRMAKDFPACRISRESTDAFVEFIEKIEVLRAEKIEEASKVLPHAFHELRKLNGAVIQHAEKEIAERGDARNLLSIKAAAELMRNNFDILEALSNIEGFKLLPLDTTINLFDLMFKMKRVYQEKAADKGIAIHVNGERLIIAGSQKSFPIVPAVLLENAIKYGRHGTHIDADLTSANGVAQMVVKNQSDERIDPATCFERGVRFSSGVEGGGFGLFLAREVVRCHDGEIWCETSGDVVRMIVEFPLKTTVPHPRGF